MTSDPPFPAVSIIIPCLNAADTIEEQLDALSAQRYPGPFEIIVADNGSFDRSREIVLGREGVRLVEASGRRGPNHARNAGAVAANGDLILVCDADDVVHPQWASAMVESLSTWDLVGGRLEFERLNPPSQKRPTVRRGGAPRHGFLPAASGANFGIRRDVLEALGGWDESFDGGADDVELCWRAQLAGYRLGYAEGAVVHYRMRSSARAVMSQAFGGGVRIPHLVRSFRNRGILIRSLARRGAGFVVYIVFMWPLAIVSRRYRWEWLRRVSLGVGLLWGLVRKRSSGRLHDDP